MCKIIRNFDKNKHNQSYSNNYRTVENQKNVFDEMKHIGIKRKLFDRFSDYFRMLGAKFYYKDHDPFVICLNKKHLAIFQITLGRFLE